MPSPNDYVVYIGADAVKAVQVVRDQKTRLQVRDANGRVERVKTTAVTASLPAGAAGDAAELQARIDELADTIDTDLLWATLADTPGCVTPKQAASDYFGDDTALAIAAATKALFDDTLHFKRRGLEFEARSHRDVSDIIGREQKKAERERLHAQAAAFFKDVLNHRATGKDTPEEIVPLIDSIDAYLVRGDNTDGKDFLDTLDLGPSPKETGLRLLQQLGRLGENVDPQLLLHGITPHFSDRLLTLADQLDAYHPGADSKREVVTEPVFSIDDRSTREIDDALSVRIHDNGTCTVGIHIADPGWFVTPGDPIDEEAAERTLSLYLPTCTVTMLPPHLSTDLASLQPGEIRPAISLFATLDEDGKPVDYRLALTELADSQRLNYHEADAIVTAAATQGQGAPEHPLATPLATLDRLARKLQNRRMANGAIRIIRPDVNVAVQNNGDTITVETVDNESPAHTIVAEFMVLLNHLLAKYTIVNDIPLIYRCQPPPANNIEPMQEYNPVLFDRAVKSMRPTFFSTHPEPHAGLGLDIYTQFSSPLRRYHDLVIQRQTVAFMHDRPMPYTQEELVQILSNAEQVEKRNRKVEREMKKFWVLEYLLRNHLKDTLSATVVDRFGNTQLAELDNYLVRGILRMSGAPPQAGTRLNVRIADVNPRNATMILQATG